MLGSVLGTLFKPLFITCLPHLCFYIIIRTPRSLPSLSAQAAMPLLSTGDADLDQWPRLNDASNFEGGGTYIEVDDLAHQIQQGDCLVHSGKLRHGGLDVSSHLKKLGCQCEARAGTLGERTRTMFRHFSPWSGLPLRSSCRHGIEPIAIMQCCRSAGHKR